MSMLDSNAVIAPPDALRHVGLPWSVISTDEAGVKDVTVNDVWLAGRFEDERAHLKAVAYRMLGSLTEADDAVQESWLRLTRTDADAIEDLRRWLTTVVARVCLDILRTRRSRREVPLHQEM